jgi:hypothetical protein
MRHGVEFLAISMVDSFWDFELNMYGYELRDHRIGQ